VLAGKSILEELDVNRRYLVVLLTVLMLIAVVVLLKITPVHA